MDGLWITLPVEALVRAVRAIVPPLVEALATCPAPQCLLCSYPISLSWKGANKLQDDERSASTPHVSASPSDLPTTAPLPRHARRLTLQSVFAPVRCSAVTPRPFRSCRRTVCSTTSLPKLSRPGTWGRVRVNKARITSSRKGCLSRLGSSTRATARMWKRRATRRSSFSMANSELDTRAQKG